MAGNPALYQQYAARFAQMYGVPVGVLEAQIGQESGWNPNAHSGAGAQGIAQFMPSTARGVRLKNGHMGVDPYNPVQALEGAAAYDAGLLHKYGSVPAMLSAYNSGRPDAYKDPHFAGGQTYNYVRNIMGHAGSFKGMTPKGVRGLRQGLAMQSGGGIDNIASQRSALLTNLVAQQNAYLTDTPYSGPTLMQALLQARQQGSPDPGAMQGAPVMSPSAAPAPRGHGENPSTPRGSTLPFLSRFAKPYGLELTSTTGGHHATNSYHYRSRAEDWSGNPNQEAQLARSALAHPQDFVEVIYTGPGNTGFSILNGKVIPNSKLSKSLYDEHTNHVHIAR